MKFLKKLLNIKWQAHALGPGLKKQDDYPTDHKAGEYLATIIGIYIIIIIVIFCPIMYLYGYNIISSFVFFYLYMLFVNMIPFYIKKKYRNFYKNILIWTAILSITSSINGYDSVGLGITLLSYILIAVKSVFDVHRNG